MNDGTAICSEIKLHWLLLVCATAHVLLDTLVMSFCFILPQGGVPPIGPVLALTTGVKTLVKWPRSKT